MSMSEARLHDRRFRTSDPQLKPGSRLCRICLQVVEVEPDLIETTPMHVYLRCPHCSCSFPIRHSDVAALDIRQRPAS